MTALHRSRAIRALLWFGGVLSLILAAIGVVLPGLPTTPFVLLAAACFVRASPRAHAWLLASRLFGPLLADWERDRRIPRRVKRFALATMAASVGVSFWFFTGRPGAQVALVVAALIGVGVVWRLPERD